MNILNKLTIKHLKMNKKRTIVSIIGIILSTALMVGIGLLMSTARENMIDMVKQEKGSQHVTIYNLNKDQYNYIQKSDQVKKVLTTEKIGYAKLNITNTNYRKYLKVLSASNDFLNTITLSEGRLPSNSNEIIVSDINILNANLGDTITLDIGERYLNGNKLPDYELEATSDEVTITNITTKEYKIVGTIEYDYYQSSTDSGIHSYTYQDTSETNINAYIYFKNPKNVRNTINMWIEELKLDIEEVNINNSLLELYGSSRYSNFISTILKSLIIILTVLSLGCIIVIYNSFAISVMERKKQFGLLSSIGTTKKQIRKTIFFESFIVGTIGIIIGVLSAYIGIGCVLIIINKLLPNVFNSNLKLATYPLFIIIPIIFMIITVLVSAFIPSRRASKITPIEAIRLNDDIKIKGKSIKTPRIIRKLFGMEAEIALKNMKRNKKKYRITILALFVSIVLFITFSGYMKYIFSEIDTYNAIPSYDAEVVIYENEDENTNKKIQEFRNEIVKNKGVEDYFNYKISYLVTTTPINKNYYTDKYYDLEGNNVDSSEESVILLEIDNDKYKEILKTINKKEIKPILYNHYEKVIYSNNTRKNYSIQKYNSNLNKTIKLCETKQETYDCRYELSDYYLANLAFFGDDLIKYSNQLVVIVPFNYYDNIIDFNDGISSGILFKTNNDTILKENIERLTSIYDINYSYDNLKENNRLVMNLIFCVKLLVYGFITLVTLIGVTSVFNTINTSIHLRKKEFAMLRSVGLSNHGFNKILLFESIFFGIKSLIYSLPVSFGIIYLLYNSFKQTTEFDTILIPYESIIISIVAVFLIIIISTLYATRKIRHENILEAIREENI